MLFFYLAIFCSLLFGLNVKCSGFYEGFLGKKQTDAIKGLFIWMVFLSHTLLEIRSSGFNFDSLLDTTGYQISSGFGQLVIVPFLFFSGYGVTEAIKNKGDDYLNHFPCHRLLTTLLNFDIAVICFVVLNLVMGIHMDWKQIGWSLIGWENVGNSNWYIFVILYCYLVTWVSGKVFAGCNLRIVVVSAAFLILAGEAALSVVKHGQHWWYDTMLCYPAGMFLSMFKEPLIAFFKRFFLPVLVLTLALFLFLHFQKVIPPYRGLTHNFKSIFFALFIVLATMKVKTGNHFLYWSGLCVFPIYIYQRLPMRFFSSLGWGCLGWRETLHFHPALCRDYMGDCSKL